MQDIEALLGYFFENKELLQRALTHPSYSHIHGGENYQRLEFLGDSIIDFIVADELCRLFPDLDEGELTKMRGAVVSASPLAQITAQKGYDKYLKTGSADTSVNIRSDLFEAICGAIYLDGGMDRVREFVLDNLSQLIQNSKNNSQRDFKSKLYEKYVNHSIEFKDNGKSGSEHCPTFTIDLYVNGVCVASAQGKSKRAAQQKCAQLFLESEQA